MSEEERKVARMIADAETDKGIAEALRVSVATARMRVMRLAARLGLYPASGSNSRVLLARRILKVLYGVPDVGEKFGEEDPVTLGASSLPADVPSRKVLTEQERRVAEMVAEGYSDPAIARELGLSTLTVRSYIARLYAKLGIYPWSGKNQRVVLMRRFLRVFHGVPDIGESLAERPAGAFSPS